MKTRDGRQLGHFLGALVTVLTTVSPVAVWAQDSPYYVVNETFVLSQEKYEGRNKIIAFLPRRYLLYIDNRKLTEEISGKEYVRALTQDGVDVFVLESDVSNAVFAESVGSHEIIFNVAFDELVCKDPGCQGDEEERYWKVARGDAFKIQEEMSSGLLKIMKGTDEIVGYVGQRAIDENIRKGFVTRVDDEHPRYEIKRTTINSITTACGKKINKLINVGTERDYVSKTLELFPEIGRINPSDGYLEIKKPYGEKDKKTSFRLYEIVDRKADDPTHKTFWVAAAFTYNCKEKSFGGEELKYIESVLMRSSRTDREFDLSIDDGPFKTPKNLREFTGAPYLISINSYEHFEDVISALSEELDDRALAGYALAELNRSCIYQERKSNARCRQHDYSEKN